MQRRIWHCKLSEHERIGWLMADNSTSDAELQKILAQFLSVDEAAAKLEWASSRLYVLVERRGVLYVKASSAILIPEAEVERLREGKQAPLAPAIAARAKLQAALRSYADIPTAAALVNLSPYATRARIARGKMRAIKVAGRTMIPLTEIERVRYERFPGGKKPRGK